MSCHPQVDFISTSIENCKATIMSKVLTNRLEDLGSVEERENKDVGHALLKQCVTSLVAMFTSAEKIESVVTQAATVPGDGEAMDPLVAIFSLQFTAARAGLDLVVVSDLVRFICNGSQTAFTGELEPNLKGACKGFLQEPWYAGIPAELIQGIDGAASVPQPLVDAVMEKGLAFQTQVKGKVLLPHILALEKDMGFRITSAL